MMSSREQQDAAEELAALRDDRDRWQTRAKQAEGQASNLAKQLVGVRGELREKTQQWSERVRQVSDLQAQLEAAAHLPDLRGEVERVAAERDAAREEVRGLQVRAQQAEGDARQANAKIRHHEHAAARWQAHAESKDSLLLKAEGAVNALQVAILNLVREVSNHDD
jgi:chromosome segregation ATPase